SGGIRAGSSPSQIANQDGISRNPPRDRDQGFPAVWRVIEEQCTATHNIEHQLAEVTEQLRTLLREVVPRNRENPQQIEGDDHDRPPVITASRRPILDDNCDDDFELGGAPVIPGNGLYHVPLDSATSISGFKSWLRQTSTARILPFIPGNSSASTRLAFEPISDRTAHPSIRPSNGKQPSKKAHPSSAFSEDARGKENQSCTNSSKNNRQSPKDRDTKIRTPVKRPPIENGSVEKRLDPLKLQLECGAIEQDTEEQSASVVPEETAPEGESNGPNKISEEILMCLSSIFLRMSRMKNRGTEPDMLSSLTSNETYEEPEFRDPYGICSEFGKRDIGPYKYLFVIEASSIDPNRRTNSLFLIRRLKPLLGKFVSVNLDGLTHQQKLAFWINIYNSRMMNAFLEDGIPESPHMIVAMMRKATINVGGHLLNAMTIEHFILKLPYHKIYICKRSKK
ncbi:PREDICTED: uncharacterized protein LOC104588908, partial [Nelumbo nucifera]|uniref:Uncharacterized protein LOC104588908 n=1 Tax=Nelumbo nucifera TaxID=4432 RepID=A0A1U8PYY9_NELNU